MSWTVNYTIPGGGGGGHLVDGDEGAVLREAREMRSRGQRVYVILRPDGSIWLEGEALQERLDG
jgi:hypothetical protein